MSRIQPTMLWEATDPQRALEARFQFASSLEACQWLGTALVDLYGMEVISVDRLVISAHNLLAWLTTTDGQFLVKCTSDFAVHERLAKIADLLVWLARKQLPVSVPMLARTAGRQVRRGHLSLSLQHMIPGELLDPTQAVQTQVAGVTLAQLQQALAAYPRVADFPVDPVPVALRDRIVTWSEAVASYSDTALVAAVKSLLRSLEGGALPALRRQLVHGDYRAANILWHEEKIAAVLDFDDLRWDYRVNDLAWAAVHLGTRYHHWGPVSDEVHATLLAAYVAQQPLSEAEVVWLPRLMLWHSINLAAATSSGKHKDAAVESMLTLKQQVEAQCKPY